MFLALAGFARLLHFQGVDAVKAYLGFTDPDGIAAHNPSQAVYIGQGGECDGEAGDDTSGIGLVMMSVIRG